MVDIVFVGMVFETIIIAIALILLSLILKKYIELKNRPTLYLFLIFLNITIAIFFSWLSKIIVLTTDIKYIYNDPNARYPNTPIYWILLRIVDFRIALDFLALAIIFSYIFKVSVFEESYNEVHKLIFFWYAGFTIFFSTFIYERGNTSLDAFNFFFFTILVAIIYIPFTIRAIISYKNSIDPFIKNKILSLILMSLSFITVIFNFLIDRILVLMGSPHFTLFYFLAWICLIIGIIFAYIGYIKPKSKKV